MKQEDALRRTFDGHPAFEACRRVHGEWVEMERGTIDVMPGEFFTAVAFWADRLRSGIQDPAAECLKMWNAAYVEHRRIYGSPSKAEVAMLLDALSRLLRAAGGSAWLECASTLDGCIARYFRSSWSPSAAEGEEVRRWAAAYFAAQSADRPLTLLITLALEEKGRKKPAPPRCGFRLASMRLAALAAGELHSVLLRRALIDGGNGAGDVLDLLSGKPCARRIVWTGPDHVLAHIVKRLLASHAVGIWPKGTSPWTVVDEWFVTPSGCQMRNLRHCNLRKGWQEAINEAVGAVEGYV